MHIARIFVRRMAVQSQFREDETIEYISRPFSLTWTKRYLITSQTRVKRNSRIHRRTILVRWCIRLMRLTLVCEVLKCRLVQFCQILQRLLGLAAHNFYSLSLPLSFSSSSFSLFFSKKILSSFSFVLGFFSSSPCLRFSAQSSPFSRCFCFSNLSYLSFSSFLISEASSFLTKKNCWRRKKRINAFKMATTNVYWASYPEPQ